MKLILITLSISVLALYAYVKQSYKYASVQDEIDAPVDYFKGGEILWQNKS